MEESFGNEVPGSCGSMCEREEFLESVEDNLHLDSYEISFTIGGLVPDSYESPIVRKFMSRER